MIVGDRPFALVDTAPSARTAWTLFAACVALEVLIVDSGKGVSLLLDVTIVKGPDSDLPHLGNLYRCQLEFIDFLAREVMP
ncbi:hypothetical protein G6L32_26030 [Agrobacterium tumefaciens]|jgi:hypothetical protein|uniref:hypothetical protein n=1 Tax=Agrobacterium TaxID=357 RepID=UPI000FDF40D8|nr:hypothetical protein [Agrobacterium sp. RS6]NSZ77108.1 hypothetical protein [Agrobacterium tumefaciens]NTA13541.1 hypothetical protein [Agrobacterium tumefaciens]NTA62087.1 hypothetical protein [Agrobacterium tumefaciens]NTZ63759.1 hypothetical protein [Agrobacterium tumefaciens]UXR94982.1 hypothetical protein FY157_25025 [Agrobacterium tumefaciens]